jgi:hypothetical protein
LRRSTCSTTPTSSWSTSSSRRGGLDALRDVRKQVRRNRQLWDAADDELPVFGTEAARFHDVGVTALYLHLMAASPRRPTGAELPAPGRPPHPRRPRALIPPTASGTSPRSPPPCAATTGAARADHLPPGAWPERSRRLAGGRRHPRRRAVLTQAAEAARGALEPAWRACRRLARAVRHRYQSDTYVYTVRGKEIHQPLVHHLAVGHPRPPRRHPRTLRRPRRDRALPDQGERAGRVPLHRRRLPAQARGRRPQAHVRRRGRPRPHQPPLPPALPGREVAHRLSTAFDSVTLYGEDPAERPDIYGKVGESGVSVPHLDDMKIGCTPASTSARRPPRVDDHQRPRARSCWRCSSTPPSTAARRRWTAKKGRAPTEAERAALRPARLSQVRGTVQADILKEDQAQNTCIFSTDVRAADDGRHPEWFIEHEVRNFYSVSISGYHIAEAGANPISQLAFTLANGFTFVEYYLARGMKIDDFAPNLSFFFSNGLDPEYTVIGRVARRIWAVAMRDRYGARPRSQMLKYHIQTSGRSLHAREIQFNDIRTTLQALLALTTTATACTPTPTTRRSPRPPTSRCAARWRSSSSSTASSACQEREHLAGQLLRRAAHRAGRGGRAGRSSSSSTAAAACSAPWSCSTSAARSRTSRWSTSSSSTTARCPSSASTPSSIPRSPATTGSPRPAELRRASPDEKDAIRSLSVARSRPPTPTRAAPRWRRLQEVAMAGGNLFDELMSHGPGGDAGPDHAGAVRGGRRLPAQPVPERADETVVPDQVEAEAEETESGSAPELLPAPTRRVRHDYVVQGAHHQLMPAQGPPPSTDERPRRVRYDRSRPARGPPARS